VDLRRDKEDPQEQEVPTEEDQQGSILATPASLATKEDQAIEDRAPQDPRMAEGTLATPGIRDSNATQETQGITLATLLATLVTHRNREVQDQGPDFLPREAQGHSRHQAPRKRRAATTVDLSLERTEECEQRRPGRVQVRVRDPPPHPLDHLPQDPCPQPSPSPGREEQSRCLPGRQAGQVKATVRV